ncbi:NAD-dependent epimerase/dehydratase family protein [Ornithinimicrobium sufpigmenti]|uniref:NAD-dependent epimerase/dehydratase family protein n=1 Tax=Ornithinimicrobium sufpigmenti TaxID=2508882 RepID=UPI001036CE54|nr:MULTISPECIES: NAD-dependent epimerase/dehydratase family protein [unclassified Ornithinimicrobium]
MARTAAVLGASGFVGGHVTKWLRQTSVVVKPVRAPRMAHSVASLKLDPYEAYLFDMLSECDVVVNAAGVADAVGSSQDMEWANHRLPGLLAQVTARLGVRLVHMSSAAVQGRRPALDSSAEYAPFSPYSASKAAGERAVLAHSSTACIYRPPGVHGPDRAVTQKLVRLARGRWATVASPGDQNSPQALIENVADAIAFLATTEEELPRIVHHPSEGLTVSSLLHLLGGRPPRRVPQTLASAAISAAFLAGRARPGLQGHARRLEMVLVGQEQAPSWLTAVGWRAPYCAGRWAELGRTSLGSSHTGSLESHRTSKR